MTTFIEDKLLSHEYQSRYWRNNSTKTLLLKLKDSNDKVITLCSQCFVDFSKAFLILSIWIFFTKLTETTFFKNIFIPSSGGLFFKSNLFCANLFQLIFYFVFKFWCTASVNFGTSTF